VNLSRALYDEMEAHARGELPNEACGIVTTRDGQPKRFHAARNLHESPMRFEIHPSDLYRIYSDAEAAGDELGILFHSHPKTEGRPSQTDINMNGNIERMWGSMTWLIASLAGDEFVLRAFEIDGGTVEEVGLDVG
jgi:[CysO sulfur-carrier protein]-S-L-cysteine hydrolase